MAEDHSNGLNPYTYLAGIVSLGPTKCGTAGYPGIIEFHLFTFFHVLLLFPIVL